MDIKKSKVYIFLFFIGFVFVFFLKNAGAGENKWKFMGKTKDKNFLMYYDPSSVNYIEDTYVRLTLRKELSDEGKEEFRKKFYASLKEAEDSSGGKVDDDPEPLIQALMKRETKEYTADIDCFRNELRIQPDKMSTVNFVVVNEIERSTAIEKIRDEVCKKK